MRKALQPKNVADRRPRYSQAILTKPGRLLFIAGQTAVDKKGELVGKGNIEKQAVQVYKNLDAIIKAAGGSRENIVKTTTFLTDRRNREGLNKVRRSYFKKVQPTSTLIIVKGLASKEYLVEVEAVAVL
ncbi:MAG: RidA family protein [Candidatus Binatia bacterium]